MHRISAGIRPHFRDSGPNGGFGIWWLFPPNPALAGNACRWAAPNQDNLHFARTSNRDNGDEDYANTKKEIDSAASTGSKSFTERLSEQIHSSWRLGSTRGNSSLDCRHAAWNTVGFQEGIWKNLQNWVVQRIWSCRTKSQQEGSQESLYLGRAWVPALVSP